MDINLMIAVAGGLLTVIGLFLGPISRYLEKREANRLLEEQFQKMMEQHPEGAMTFSTYMTTVPTPEPKPKGFLVLIIFAIVVAIFGLCTAAYFWSYLY